MAGYLENCMNKQRTILFVALASLAAGCANEPRSRDTANPNVSGETLAMQVCSNCHGASGTANSPNFPNLAAQQEAYLIAQLSEFRSHSRQDPVGYEYMWGLSHHLTDKQINELAAHFAAQKPLRQAVEGKSEHIEAGKAIFIAGVAAKGIPPCASCHGAQAEGNGKFPRLAGQHIDYLVKQLAVFQRSNDRPEGSLMKTVAHELTRENIENVAAYLQAMPNL